MDSFFEELLDMDFFKNNVSWQGDDKKKEEVRKVLLRGVELMNCFTGEKQANEELSDLTDKQKIYLTSAIEYLSAAFEGEETGNSGEQLSLLLCLAEVAQNEEIAPEMFKNWWNKVIGAKKCS